MPCDVVIVGGGIVGLATAWRLLEQRPCRLVVLEAAAEIATHQTGSNSGVVHAGLYYRPGSLKARLCTEGRESLYRFCDEHGVPVERCGKLVLATRPDEVPRLERLHEMGVANGLRGLRRLAAEAITDVEPHARGVAGLHVPDTGIVDYRQMCAALARPSKLEVARCVAARARSAVSLMVNAYACSPQVVTSPAGSWSGALGCTRIASHGRAGSSRRSRSSRSVASTTNSYRIGASWCDT
jgi:L-2-hydroxyglutarate oxidase